MRRTGLWAAWMGIVAAGCFAAWAQAPVQIRKLRLRPLRPVRLTLRPLRPRPRRRQPRRPRPIRPRRLGPPQFKLSRGQAARHGEERQHSPARRDCDRAKHGHRKRYSTTTGISGAWSLNVPPDRPLRHSLQSLRVLRRDAGGGAQRREQRSDRDICIDIGFAGGGAAEERVGESASQQAGNAATGQ
jgi:hypothetical protein